MRRETTEQVARRLGFSHRAAGEAGFCRRYGDLPPVRGSAAARHIIEGTLEGRSLTIFTSSYTVYTGQVNVPVMHTIYAAGAVPWPTVYAAPRSALGRLAHRLGWRRGVELDDPAFSNAFRVTGADDDFTITLLTPEVQTFLLTKRNVRWYVGAGRVCLIYGGALRPERLEASIDRLRRFLQLIPPELEAWS